MDRIQKAYVLTNEEVSLLQTLIHKELVRYEERCTFDENGPQIDKLPYTEMQRYKMLKEIYNTF